MSEEVPGTTEPDPDETEAASLAVSDAAGNRMVPLSALIAQKKENKTLKSKIGELEPIAARASEIDQKLEAAAPILNAIRNDPKLNATVARIAAGTHATSAAADQPADDEDAAGYAEDMGWYTDAGQVDAARGRRVLDRLDKRSGRQVNDAIRPLAGVTLGQKANENLRDVLNMIDANGTPMVSEESIREVASKLPPALLADPAVKELVLNYGIGLDRQKNRTPKAQDEPLFLESSRRGGSRSSGIDSELKASAERVGLSEEALKKSAEKHGWATTGGRR